MSSTWRSVPQGLALCIPNVMGHFMRTPGSQPLPPQTCPKQVRAYVSSHTLPGRSHCFLLALHATDLRSPGTRHAARELLFATTPSLFSKPSSDSIPIAPAPLRRFSPIHF